MDPCIGTYVELAEMLDGGAPIEIDDLTRDQWRAIGIIRQEREAAAWRTRLNSLFPQTTKPPLK
jgi:hypothetical protein